MLYTTKLILQLPASGDFSTTQEEYIPQSRVVPLVTRLAILLLFQMQIHIHALE